MEGRRGAGLVNRAELERVRAMGCEPPKQVVVWVSDTEPGAGHEIRSVDEHGQTRWIEVKSTTGADGWFEWPRREFERAITARQ